MRPIALVADIHIGNSKRFGGPSTNSLNRRCLETIATVKYSVAQALEFDASAYVMLGDVFDTSRPIPPMVAATHDALSYSGARTMQEIAIVGNHDKQSSDDDDHALASMKRGSGHDYWIVDTPSMIGPTLDGFSPTMPELVNIPYTEGDAREWLPEQLHTLFAAYTKVKNVPRALCIHLGVYSEKYTAFIGGRSARDAVPVSLLDTLMEQYDIDACFAGNWHARKTFKTRSGKPIIQVGSLCPTGWSDKGLRGHGMSIWHPSTGEIQHVEVRGPRFVDLPRGLDESLAALEKLRKYSDWNHLYIRAIAEDRDEMAVLRDAITEVGGTPDIQLDKVLAQCAARTAATVAKSADNREAALGSYINAMEVEEGVDKGAVLESCKRYLHG